MRAARMAIASCAALAAAVLNAPDALGCSAIAPPRFEIDPSVRDAPPPVLLGIAASVDRSDPHGPSTCAGLSSLTLQATVADGAPVGLVVAPAGGSAPRELAAPSGPFAVDADGGVAIPFFTDGRPLKFSLAVTPVGRSGARGPAKVLTIDEPAYGTAASSDAAGVPYSALLASVAVIASGAIGAWLVVRRRTARRRQGAGGSSSPATRL